MDKYEGGGFMYYTTLPTDALTQFAEVIQESEAMGYPLMMQRMQELGDKVRATLARRGFASVAAEGFEAPGVVVAYTSIPGWFKSATAACRLPLYTPLYTGRPLYRPFHHG